MKNYLALFALLALPSGVAAAGSPGLVTRDIPAPHHGRPMHMAIWYPGQGGTERLFADNPIFKGSLVLEGAKLAGGQHPVVLLSHGMGGTFLSLNWLATGLAARGALVVAVDHPNGSAGDRDPAKMFDHWTRAQDLQAALDNVLSDKALSKGIDPSRVYAVGFSFGGWTALSLAGVRARPDGNMGYCAKAPRRNMPCSDLSSFGVSQQTLDATRWSASYQDHRVRAVAAIDPGLTFGLTKDDVSSLDPHRLLLIGLGTGADRLYVTDTSDRGSGFEALVPGSKIERLAPANHFTAMPICKPQGAAILAEEKDDPVCSDPAGGDRQAIHTRIIDLIAAHFGLN
jgi:predicted dienelactone hydrolase